MIQQTLLITAGVVIALCGLMCVYHRWIRPWVSRRWMEKTLAKIRASNYTPPKHPDLIELIEGRIRYQFNGSLVWELPLACIRVIGESTNDHGPFLDDYFLCFATDADNWYEASFYSDGREQFLKSLALALQCELVLKLVGSTNYDSNVLWPAQLAGRKMFLYKPVEPETWFGRLFGYWSNTQSFSNDVLAELGQG